MPVRVYALEGEPVPEPNDVVEGTVNISGKKGSILYDPGATHSFISKKFAKKFAFPVQKAECVYEVNNH